MWFKLATANFADKNLGTMADIAGSWGVTYTLQGNISKDNCPTTVKMNDGKTQAAVDFTATFTLGEGATLTSITAKLKSSGAQLIQVTSGISITIPAASITGDIEIIAIATGSSTGGGSEGDDNGNSGSGSTTPDTPADGNYDWTTAAVTFEVGSTNDDTAGTMGNKTTNANRLRSSEAIKCDAIRITAPVGMWVWYNLFDDDGKLVGTSGSSKSFTNSTGTGTASMEIILKNVGATQIWPIFKGNDAGNTPVTDEQKSQIVIETKTVPDSLDITWEVGTFDDDTGEKVDNVARLRTSTKIAVPTTATGIMFIPTGTFDLWIKTYDTADQGKPTMNGIKGSMYWNTSYDDVPSLSWSQICTNNTRPAYVDFVLKTAASNLVPSDAANVIINFI